MRKCQQKQILDVLDSLEEAQTAGLYADCQDGALGIGEYIEQIKGEGTQTVALLEEYCDLLYKTSIGEASQSILKKALIRIENSVKNELKPDRIEVVFLSYKASMSDSIESIYLDAKDDPSCDAYWLPIPYYDLKPDGSFEKLHYEGQDYYKPHIECTDLHDYNIEERRPDVIFTFAPYDDVGRMTSVHPDFYCERLRNLTDMLVYVPYFVTDERICDPYTTCAGVIFSHLVVVQSEEVRQCYIRDYKEFEKLGYSSAVYGAAKYKIIALGSPKFDAVINAKKEDFTLPEDWRTLIADKKVIFYNTSITGILNGREKYLKKIRYVHETFRNRTDVVLWWRPHPLSETAYKSMEPELVEEYLSIIDDYKQTSFGIYDDTSDLHRSIAWSDAYFGDWSSLIMLFQQTGKPVMLGDSNVIHDYIVFSPAVGVCIIDNNIWIPIKRINALIKMKISNWEPEFIGSFPGELDYDRKYNFPLYQRPTEKDGVIYFPPYMANEIASYNLKDGIFNKIEYDRSFSNPEIYADFTEAVNYKEDIFFIPNRYHAILRLNTVTNEITYFSDWAEQIKKRAGYIDDSFFVFSHIAGNTIMLAACGTNAVVEFNMETYATTIHDVGKKGYRYNGICYDGENYWLSPRCNTPIIRWNPQSGETKELTDFYFDEKDKSPFLPCFYSNGYVWLISVFASHTLKIDILTETFVIVEEFECNDPDEKGNDRFKYIFAKEHNNSIFALRLEGGTMIEYNCKTKERKEEIITYPPEVVSLIEPLIAKAMIVEPDDIKTTYDSIYYEYDLIRLKDFINYLVLYSDSDEEANMIEKRIEIARSQNANIEGKSGSEIYEYIKKRSLTMT